MLIDNEQKNIYVDNAATTKMSERAINAMYPYMREVYGNPSSLHNVGQIAKEALENARERIAKYIGCMPREITFTSGGSEADNQAIISAAMLGKKQGKNHIVSSKFEHHAVLHTLDKLKKEGFEVTLLDVGEKGLIDPKQVEEAIKDTTCLVSIMYANNEIGTIEPIKEIGEICKAKGVLFHTDAVQAVGHLKINVKDENIDMLSCSAHKFHGPKGVGFLYSKVSIPLVNVIEGGAQEKGKRGGTENMPAIMGMAEALEESLENLEQKQEKLIKLRDRLIEGFGEIEHSILNGDREKRLPGNVHYCFEGIEGEAMLLLLNDKGIYSSSGSACTSGSLDPSHVLLAIGRPHEIAHGSLRISLSEEISDDDVEYIISSVKEVVEYLRNMSPVWRDLKDGKQEFVIKGESK